VYFYFAGYQKRDELPKLMLGGDSLPLAMMAKVQFLTIGWNTKRYSLDSHHLISYKL
jgi:hypothetical protein